MEIAPVSNMFVAEVSGINIAEPIETATIDEIWSAIDRYAVLVFRDQQLSDAQLRDFADRFGPRS
jgi:alpha-ketoglutarate-dependent 2,4-dichlorophenoxyacetate dioxygenase